MPKIWIVQTKLIQSKVHRVTQCPHSLFSIMTAGCLVLKRSTLKPNPTPEVLSITTIYIKTCLHSVVLFTVPRNL